MKKWTNILSADHLPSVCLALALTLGLTEKQGFVCCCVSSSQQSAWPSQTPSTQCSMNAHNVLSVGLNQVLFENLVIRHNTSKGVVKGLKGA